MSFLPLDTLCIRKPEVDLIPIQVMDGHRGSSPLRILRGDSLALDVLQDGGALSIIEANEDAPMAGAVVRRALLLIQNNLEPKKTYLNHIRSTILLVRPIQIESEGTSVELDGARCVLNEEHGSGAEIVHWLGLS